MLRREFVRFAQLAATAAAVYAQEKKETRWSGTVTDVDTGKSQIKMHTRQTPGVERVVQYDDKTSILTDGKPGKADDAKTGYRIVAHGTFEGNNLKASRIEMFKK